MVAGFWGAPPMYVAWINTPGIEHYDLSSIRFPGSGAAWAGIEVGDRILQIGSIETPHGAALQAAMAGGKVGVFSGAFDVATTDDELAVIIAHEIAHVTARHVHELLSQEMLMRTGGVGVAGDENGDGVLITLE